ncbi:MAG TPA: hypothetical protein VF322_06945 [Gammaproteobacteria bacterium]
MSAEEQHAAWPSAEPGKDSAGETLTDLMDRMDREAFRRVLEQRHPRPPPDTPRERPH